MSNIKVQVDIGEYYAWFHFNGLAERQGMQSKQTTYIQQDSNPLFSFSNWRIRPLCH